MFTTRPELAGTFGMVASTHWLASAAGMAMLEAGGNAFDAATTAGFVLQVVEPHLNGPGGEVPIVFYSKARDQVLVVDGQGPAPAAATVERFAELGLDLIPGTGLLAACVPGAFDAWMLLLRDFGTKRVGEVLSYAIDYARNGYPLVPRISATIAAVERLFREQWHDSAGLYLRDGVPAPGTIFRNESLARTYERIVEQAESAASGRDAQIDAARDAFYRGFVAEAVARYCADVEAMDVSGRRHRGLLVADDLAGWSAGLENAVSLDYEHYRVFKAGAWTQGPVFLQQLALLRGFDLSSLELNGTEYVHTVVECAKLAFADREAYYGDPAFVDVPLDILLSDDYARQRRAQIERRASLDLRPGTIDGTPPPLPELPDPSSVPVYAATGYGAGEPTVARTGETNGDTCHVDVVDRDGNMVAATPSGGWLQSSPVIPDLGFCLGTRAQMFWLQPGLPNSLEPRKRPRTTLTPSLAFRRGEPYLAFGTPGGDTQDQWSLNFFLAHVHFGLNLQEAIDAPMFHTTHFPSSFYPRTASPGEVAVEGRFQAEVVDELRARGHLVSVEEAWSLGRLSAVARDHGVLKAAANPRGVQGYAVGR